MMDVLDWTQLSSCSRVPECYSEQLTYRFSFATFLLFSLLMVLACTPMASGATHELFVAKFAMIFLVAIILCFLPNDMFVGFAEFASYVGSAFLLLQILVVIDFGYSWNELWTGHAHSERQANILDESLGQRWFKGILASSAALLLASVAGEVYLFVNYTEGLQRLEVCFGFLVAVGAGVLACSDWCDHGALLPSCCIVAYVWFLTASSLSPDNIGWIVSLALLAVGAHAFDPKEAPDLFHKSAPEAGVDEELANAGGLASGEAAPPPPPVGWFHFGLQGLASLYLCCALTNWTANPSAKGTTHVVGLVLCLLLYIWTLVAPKVFPDREF